MDEALFFPHYKSVVYLPTISSKPFVWLQSLFLKRCLYMLSESTIVTIIGGLSTGVVAMGGLIIRLWSRIGKLEDLKASKEEVDAKIEKSNTHVIEEITQIGYRMDKKDEVDNEYKREIANNMGYIRAKLEAG
jgi:hypothetical protein